MPHPNHKLADHRAFTPSVELRAKCSLQESYFRVNFSVLYLFVLNFFVKHLPVDRRAPNHKKNRRQAK